MSIVATRLNFWISSRSPKIENVTLESVKRLPVLKEGLRSAAVMRSVPLTRLLLTAFATTVIQAGCANTYHVAYPSEDEYSTVEYVDAKGHRHSQDGPGRVRYETIQRTSTGSVVSYLPQFPHEHATEAHDTNPDIDIPLEDRTEVKRRSRSARSEKVDASTYDVKLIAPGVAFPYPATKMFRGFGHCRRGKHHHEGIDLGGVGENWGIGTPIRAMAKSEVLFIGTGKEDPDKFGLPDNRSGEAFRGDRYLPRSATIDPYGVVHFFTQRKGSWRSGNVIILRGIDGPLAGHVMRYMHLGAIHPSLKVGDKVELGQEVGVMGGTGVQESAPHLHLDIARPDGGRVDIAPLLGLSETASCEGRDYGLQTEGSSSMAVASKASSRASRDDQPVKATTSTRSAEHASLAPRSPAKAIEPEQIERGAQASNGVFYGGKVALVDCKSSEIKEDFKSGRFASHTFEFEAKKGHTYQVELSRDAGNWKPKLDLESGKTLASGKVGKRAASALKAKSNSTIRLEVSGWGAKPPQDAQYKLRVVEKCTKGKR